MKTTVSVLLSLFSLFAFSQQHYYYNGRGDSIQLTKIEGTFLIHLKDGIPENGFQSEGYQYLGEYFVITDTNNINDLYSNYTLSRAFFSGADTLFESDEIVLRFKETTTPSQKSSIENQHSLSLIATNDIYTRYSSNTPLESSNNIYLSGLVEFAKPNFFFRIKPTYQPNDTYYNKQWYLHNIGSSQIINDGGSGLADADMDVEEAWDITKGDSNLVIAVFDQGVTSNHPDLPNTRQVR